jgi:hypothetical protein
VIVHAAVGRDRTAMRCDRKTVGRDRRVVAARSTGREGSLEGRAVRRRPERGAGLGLAQACCVEVSGRLAPSPDLGSLPLLLTHDNEASLCVYLSAAELQSWECTTHSILLLYFLLSLNRTRHSYNAEKNSHTIVAVLISRASRIKSRHPSLLISSQAPTRYPLKIT